MGITICGKYNYILSMDWQLKAILVFITYLIVSMFWLPSQFVVGFITYILIKKKKKISAVRWVSFYTIITVFYVLFYALIPSFDQKYLPSHVIVPILTISIQIFIYKYFSKRLLP